MNRVRTVGEPSAVRTAAVLFERRWVRGGKDRWSCVITIAGGQAAVLRFDTGAIELLVVRNWGGSKRPCIAHIRDMGMLGRSVARSVVQAISQIIQNDELYEFPKPVVEAITRFSGCLSRRRVPAT